MPPVATPSRLVLATDLSPRCDRALDRARQLAGQWHAKLIAVHAVEPSGLDNWCGPQGAAPRPTVANPLSVASRRLRRSLGDAIDDIEVLVAEGPCAEVMSETALARDAGLIVTGVARDEVLGRLHLGRSVDALVRHSHLPLLVVRDRPRGPYARIVVASDFSEGSAAPLLTAAAWFPGVSLALLHAYEPPFAGLTADRDAYVEDYRAVVEKEADAFLATTSLGRNAMDVALMPGSPAAVLATHVEARAIDLVVIGSGEKSLLHRLLASSNETSILAEVPCDILIVPKGISEHQEG